MRAIQFLDVLFDQAFGTDLVHADVPLIGMLPRHQLVPNGRFLARLDGVTQSLGLESRPLGSSLGALGTVAQPSRPVLRGGGEYPPAAMANLGRSDFCQNSLGCADQ